MLESLKDKKILILGFGKEGIDTYLALRKIFPAKILGIADRKGIMSYELGIRNLLTKDKNLKLYLGENYLNKVGEYDLIIKTPGISNNSFNPIARSESVSSTQITSQTEIFFDNFPGIIVGVTGTKGKGTTSSLIYEILKQASLRVYLGGNIGKPVLQYLLRARPDDIFIYELSSHQLQNLKKSPQIAVFLNIMQDHLDYYKNQTEYERAKANITLHQTKNDYLIFNNQDKKVKQIAQKSQATKIPFSLAKKNNLFKIISQKDISLKGEFNLLNIIASVEVAKIFKIENKTIKQAIKNFKGLPHRLEFVGKFKNIEFYDNSMATIPQTTILDLKTFKNKPISLIAGGSNKGNNYTDLAKEISKSSVLNLIILGEGTGQKIAEKVSNGIPPRNLNSVLGRATLRNFFRAQTMKEAVKVCYEKTPKNGVCLLSPASASFNMFKDYKDRGEQFKKAVKFYAK
ncbi:MAG: UDP-N-acetylmuramoyl-L-alanine--D-glutamate ligase [Candidatus Pacebacteria bacterium]|nr:UDP-N-acetylmuramoyl-L-alanine--D-glutamate ligase [Candidatus Paceibacterota bacterium]